jgi:hypothetical protein
MMIQEDLQRLKSLIESEGVFVAVQPDHSLFVACGSRTIGDLQLFQQSLVLYHDKGGWRGVFPGEGMAVYEVNGGLDELISLIIQLIREGKNAKTTWSQAFQRIVPNHSAYLHLPS